MERPADVYLSAYRDAGLVISAPDIGTLNSPKLIDDIQWLQGQEIRMLITTGERLALEPRDMECVQEMIVLDPRGGIRDKEGGVVPVLTTDGITRILEDRHNSVTAHGRKTQLKKIRALLGSIGRIAITDPDGLRSEIEQWQGSGTLCVAPHTLEVTSLKPEESALFRKIYEDLLSEGRFRERTNEQLDELERTHTVVRSKTPLGGASLIPGDHWSEISAVWSLGNGLAGYVLREFKEKSLQPIYGLTKNPAMQKAFEYNGFQSHGNLGHPADTLPPSLWEELRQQKRKDTDPPWIYTYGKEGL